MASLVLVVERTDTIYEYLRNALRPPAVIVQQVRSLPEVDGVLQQWRPTAIVVDAALGEDCADELRKRVAALRCAVPVLRCAARSRDESRYTTSLPDLTRAILGIDTAP